MIDERARVNILFALACLILLLALLSGFDPYDRLTWFMEVLPVFVAIPFLAATYRVFPLTSLLYGLIFTHAVILIVGGLYTYARVPLGFWIQDMLSLDRNPYDKIGHFAQGFGPALIAREIFLRGAFVTGRKMVTFLCVCVAMAISAWYELIEWAAALYLGQSADEFLGLQGDQWDTQSDMFYAFLGALVALALLSRVHDRQIAALQKISSPKR